MINSIPTTYVGTGVVALGGVILLWWLTGRLRAGGLRNFVRIITVPLLVIGVALMGVMMAKSETEILPETTPLLVPVETMTVQPGTLTETLNATGSLAAADQTALAFGTSAPVTDVLVSVGNVVHKGDVLARVDTTAIDMQVRTAQINLEVAQNALDALEAPPSEYDLKSAELSVLSAQASLSSASQSASTGNDAEIARLNTELAKNSLWQQQLSRDMSANPNPNAPNAVANRIASQANMANAEENVTDAEQSYQDTLNAVPDTSQLSSANASLISAQAKLDALNAGPSDTDLRKAQINIETAQLNLDTVQQQHDEAEIVAPFDGIVAAVNVEVGEMPPNAGAITLIDTNNYTITLSVDEKDIAQLAQGQAVNVTLQALNNVTLSGNVTRVDLSPSSTSDLVTYNVEVTLNPADAPVRPGMSAVANVVLNELNNVLVVPNRFITVNDRTQQATVKVETADGTYTDVPVTIGAQTDSESAITAGINPGDKLVILASSATTGTSQTGNFGLFGGAGRIATGGGAPPGGGNFRGGG